MGENSNPRRNNYPQFTLRDVALATLLLCLVLALTVQLGLLGFCVGAYCGGIIYGWSYSQGSVFAGSISQLLLIAILVGSFWLMFHQYFEVMNFEIMNGPIFIACVATIISSAIQAFHLPAIPFTWRAQATSIFVRIFWSLLITLPFTMCFVGVGRA